MKKIYILSWLVLAASVFASAQTQVIDARWPLNGGSGIESNGRYNGTSNQVRATKGMMGLNSTAGVFNGVNSYVSIPSSVTSILSGDFSIYAIVKTPDQFSDTVYYPIIFALNTYNFAQPNGMNLYIYNANSPSRKFGFICRPTGSPSWNSNFIQSTTTPQPNTWYIITATRQNGLMKLFINGKLENSLQGMNTPIDFGQAPLGFIGRKDNGNLWKGIIDEVFIYHFALNPTDIADFSDRLEREIAAHEQSTSQPETSSSLSDQLLVKTLGAG